MFTALFNDCYPPQTDGVAVTVRNYAVWLNRKHGRCCVIAPQHPLAAHATPEDFPVIRYAAIPLMVDKQYSLGLPDIAFRTTAKLDAMPIEIVHAHSPFSSGTYALTMARKKDVPLVATFHSKYADDFAQRLKIENAGKLVAKYTASFYAQADAVWAVNHATARTLEEYGYRGPITVMPNGCDFTPVERTMENRARVLGGFGIADQPVMLFVGRLVEQKNISFLLNAAAAIRDTGYHLLFVGEGEGAAHYKKLAAELGLADRVTFAGIIRDREALRSIYAAADLFVLPSVYDNAPLVVREAAACGCPSVLITGSNSAEGVEHGINGFTSALDLKAYSDLLRGLISNPTLIKDAGINARKTIYTPWETVIDRAAAEYEHVVADYRLRSRKPKQYSIPLVLVREMYRRQANKIRFTAKRMHRVSSQNALVLREARVQKALAAKQRRRASKAR